MKATIHIELDGKIYEAALPLTEIVAAPKPYLMLNVVNWKPLVVPYADISEATYFVLPVSSTGFLIGSSTPAETKFVQDLHAAGKKATFSIAGGSQDVDSLITDGEPGDLHCGYCPASEAIRVRRGDLRL
jgi:hypothetical protein